MPGMLAPCKTTRMRDVGLSAATVLLCASDGKARLAPFPLDWWQPAQLFKYTIAPGRVASPLRSAKAVGLVVCLFDRPREPREAA